MVRERQPSTRKDAPTHPSHRQTPHSLYPTPSPESKEAIEIPDFTGSMAAVVVGFFENRSHAEQLKQLGVAPLDPELVGAAYDLAQEDLNPKINRAQLRHDALQKLGKLAGLSAVKQEAWLLMQPEEVRDVMRELMNHAAGMIQKHALDEAITLAHNEALRSTNQRGNRPYN